MKTSESISKIAPALLKAQKAITFAAKDATNPAFRSKYADLPSVIDAIKSALNDAGIVFIQTPSPSDAGMLFLTTRLLHESGEWIEDVATTPFAKHDPQGYGSAITYLRRYSLSSITGLYQDDDDGNAASKPEEKEYITADQITVIQDSLAAAGLTAKDLCDAAKVNSLAKIEKNNYARVIAWIGKNTKVKS